MAATATLPLDLQDELPLLLNSLEGLERAKLLAIASTVCVLYDIMLTFGDEMRYFWKGTWTLSRVLFFVNRYFPPIVLMLCLIGFFGPNLSVDACSKLIHSTFFLTIVAVGVVQAVIVLRICYVYSKNRLARASIVGCFISANVVTFVMFGLIWHDINPIAFNVPGMKSTGCTAPPSRDVWRLYVPNLVLHTVLYLATTIPALRMRRSRQHSKLMDRLARDGGIFYFTIFAVAMFSTIGSLAKTPLVTIPAIYSNVLLALASIAVSRLMLSIRSLAARLSLAPDWLLNNTELGRVNWKPGRTAGELIVEVEAIEADFELKSIDDDSPTSQRVRTPMLHTTRVGVLEHSVYPGARDYREPPQMPRRPQIAFSDRPPLYVPQPIYRDPTLLLRYDSDSRHIVR